MNLKGPVEEDPRYLSEQLITYLGNKRALLDFIGQGLERVKARLGQEKLKTFDVFSGSGVVARYLKAHSRLLLVNDLEDYSALINRCYLTNSDDLDLAGLGAVHGEIARKLEQGPLEPGIIAQEYAPRDDEDIQAGERVFYTRRNACYLDTARRLIAEAPEHFQPYLLGPLLSEASVHANTSGVFKGFYKDKATGLGHFGGQGRDALKRILGPIELPFPLLSRFSCESRIYQADANELCDKIEEVDLAYLDPPYNQHPYGSNYFMLNLLLHNQRPRKVSRVSGIPEDWKRSSYNSARLAEAALEDLVGRIKARFLLISFNSEGFIPREHMVRLLEAHGRLELLEIRYNTFRGSRNLRNRDIHLKEYLYLLEKN